MKHIKKINEKYWIGKSILSEQDLLEIKDIFSDIVDETDYRLDDASEYPSVRNSVYCVSFFKPNGRSSLINVIIEVFLN